MSAPESFGIASQRWPGLAKLGEEAGEVVQIVCKIIATGGTLHYDDGTEIDQAKLWDEVGDLRAAIEYFVESNPAPVGVIVSARFSEKLALYRQWRDSES